jgi:hypothetical protein
MENSMSDRKGDWIQTFTGRQYWPLDPHPSDVCIEDIAHHLSMLCRFTGACKRFYSVAEHSVHVSYLVPPELALHGLLHDASEAYCNDIARPVKRNIQGYAEIEALNDDAIRDAFSVPAPTLGALAVVKFADNAILIAEQAAIMAPCAHRWRPENVPTDMQAAAPRLMRPGWWRRVLWRFTWYRKRRFLQRWRELTK